MREGFISDGSRTVKITIWGDMIDMLKEDHLLQISNCSSRIFNEELVITTNFSSSVCYLTEKFDITFDESKLTYTETQSESFLCCPEIESIKIDNHRKCKVCKKKVIVTPGTGLCACSNCKREYTSKLIEGSPGCFQKMVSLDLKTLEGTLTVSVFEDVIKNFFDQDVYNNDTQLKNKFLNLTKVDFWIKKRIVKDMKVHS